MSRKKIAIIHFYPLEYFPPITNLLNFFSTKHIELKICVFTTHNNKGRKIYRADGIEIKRSPFPTLEDSKFVKGLIYSYFNCYTLIHLILKRPRLILYYETISSWPVYVYSRFINRKCDILIHFHEYASLEWYSKHMKLVKYYHKLETSYLYNKSTWISQTNRHRLKMFLEDNPKIEADKLWILPNYPPKKWSLHLKTEKFTDNSRLERSKILKTVYIGSLAIESSYIIEYCEWVKQQEGAVICDIYSYITHEDTKNYLNNLGCSFISFNEKGIEYDDIPEILKNYHVGLILYKDYSLNVKYCAPNKLFEYLACGLDVWYSEELMGCHDYKSLDDGPLVLPLNFKKINSLNVTDFKDNSSPITYKNFNCEELNEVLLKKIVDINQ